MIRYELRCAPEGHGFDGWFRSGDDFDRQAARSLVSCPVCGATAVAKALMRPAVSSERAAPPSAVSGDRRTATMPTAEMATMYAKLQEMAREVRARADYVGPQFAEEARRIHYGESEQRQIYGEASGADIRSLAEEGIPALPMPTLPEDKN